MRPVGSPRWRWSSVALVAWALGSAAGPSHGEPPLASFCGGASAPSPGAYLLRVTDGGPCNPASAVGRVSGNAVESVASLDGRTFYVVYSDLSNPTNAKLVTVADGQCEPEIQLNIQAAAGISSHDAPSVFVDGEGYVYATYNGGTNGMNGPLIRKSREPGVPESFGTEQSSRLFQGAEAHGFTGHDGAVYLVGHNVNTRLDVIEPNGVGGVISYRHPVGPLSVIAGNPSPLSIPGCLPETTTGGRFTKGYIAEGVTSGGDPILLAVWGWALGAAGACPDIQAYGTDSHEVFFAYSLDAGRTWWNRPGSAQRTAPNCSDPADCVDPSHGITMNDPAFVVTATRQRHIRAAYYDGVTDTIYLSFARSTWCDRGTCLTPNPKDPGALMLLRFQLGSGPVLERKVSDGDYTQIPAIRKAPDDRLYLYAASGGRYYEHVSDDDGLTWSRTELVNPMSRVHGHAYLPCAPSTIATAGSSNQGPFYFVRRSFAPEPGFLAQTFTAIGALLGLARWRTRRPR